MSAARATDQTVAPANGPLPYIAQIVGAALQLNIAIPVIFEFAKLAAETWRNMFGGEAVNLAEIATLIENEVEANRQRGVDEIARLRAKIDAQQQLQQLEPPAPTVPELAQPPQ